MLSDVSLISSFNFLCAGEIRFGRGQAASAAELAVRYGPSVVLVHGGNSSGADWLVDDLGKHGAYLITVQCGREPTLPELELNLRRLRGKAPHVVVSLGGGSVVDMGKAIAALLPCAGAPLDYLEAVGQGRVLDRAPVPFVAIPTTAGTGTEVTHNAVIEVPSAGRKASLSDVRMTPDISIVDPSLMEGVPKTVMLVAGLDALTQVIELYVCSKATPGTDAFCHGAIPMGMAALISLMKCETPEAWDTIALVSLYCGLALSNSGLGAVHGLAGVVGGVTGSPRGAICGALLADVIKANFARAVPGTEAHTRLAWVIDQIADAFKVSSPQAGLDQLKEWSRDNGLPTLGQMGVSDTELPSIAASAMEASSMNANPVPLTKLDLATILTNAI